MSTLTAAGRTAIRHDAAEERRAALLKLAEARRIAALGKTEVEALILGTQKVSEP